MERRANENSGKAYIAHAYVERAFTWNAVQLGKGWLCNLRRYVFPGRRERRMEGEQRGKAAMKLVYYIEDGNILNFSY